ncbi:MAG: hypothetical protein GY725_22040 [bacterium]|nr:hypothetical protein [bacterium]
MLLLVLVPLPACAQDGATGANLETAKEEPAIDSRVPAPEGDAARQGRESSVKSGVSGGSKPAVGSSPDAPTTPTTRPSLDLNRLLRPRLPVVAPVVETQPGGRDRETWEREFSQAHQEVAELEAVLEVSKTRLRESATADWGYSPTGGSLPTDPEVQRLRAQLKRDRRSLETAERRLRELQIEASLAGVPEHWQEPKR